MKHRAVALIFVLVLLFSSLISLSCAELDYENTYETALRLAGNDLSNTQNLNDATEMLEQTGSYSFSRSYLIYFQQMAAIQSPEPDIDTIVLMLGICKDNAPFCEDLETRKLPSCTDLLSYAQARRLELNGELDQALNAYRMMSILDAPDRAVLLTLELAKSASSSTDSTLTKDYVGNGDVNSDGIINILDILNLQQYVSGGDVSVNPTACDVNGDGAVNVLDIQALQTMVVKNSATDPDNQ